jgi:hypothetical protein
VAERLGILGQHLIRADHPPPLAAAAGGGSRSHGLASASASASAARLVAKAAVLAGGLGLGYTLKRAYPAYQPVSRQDYSRVPASSEVDAAWLTAALRASGELPPEARVRGAAVVPVKVKVDWAGASTDDDGQADNGGGMSGAGLVRVAGIVYEPHGGGGESALAALPSTMIHKWSAVGQSQNNMEWTGMAVGIDWPLPNPKKWLEGVVSRYESLKPGAGGMGRWQENSIKLEAMFYSEFASELAAAGVRVPRCFHIGLDGPSQPTPDFLYILSRWSTNLRMSLLMEDLGGAGFLSGFGNSLQRGQATAILRAAARVHAWGWGKLDSKMAARPAMCVNMEGAFDKDELAEFETDGRLDAYITHFSPQRGYLKDPETLQLMKNVRADTPHWLARRAAVPAAQTILHGDLHTGNTMVRPLPTDATAEQAADPASVCLIDWQCFGCGPVAAELMYFLNARNGWGAEVDDTADVETDEELMAAYHMELVAVAGEKVTGR